MKQTLIDTFEIRPQIVESDGNKYLKFAGIGQRYGIKNGNNRVYPKEIFENLLHGALKERLEKRQVVGHMNGHPVNGQTDPEKISHVITSVNLGESGEVLISGEILDTPSGKILESLLKAGITLGISSRGSGSVKNVGGVDYVQPDFDLVAWDYVMNPSTNQAYPRLVAEEISNENNTKETSMSPQEKLAMLSEKAGTVLKVANKVDANLYTIIQETASNLVIELTRLSTEAPELKNLTEDLISDLTQKRKAFKKIEEKESEKEEKDEKEEKKHGKDCSCPKCKMNEETSGSAETGWTRSVPKEAEPAKGEGWPVNPNDAGVLAGINAGVDEFMKNAKPVLESEEEFEDEVVEAKDKEDDDDDEDDSKEESVNDRLAEIAYNIISLPETETNSVARAFAAAFLMESGRRQNEVSGLNKIIAKMQDRFIEAKESGEIKLGESDSEELQGKYEEALKTIEEITSRHRLLSAKVYAEQSLEKIGLRADTEARKVVAEAIRKATTKVSIDEAIARLVAIKGLNVKKEEIKESKKEAILDEAKKVEEKVANLSEAKKPVSAKSGAEFGKKLSKSLSFSRSR